LAEAVCKKQLADRLGCKVSELPGQGFIVGSAGVATWEGLPASAEAEHAGREIGADLSGHCSRPVDANVLSAATDVIAMTAGHANLLRALFPDVGPPPVLLAGTADLNDPIGSDAAVYQACAEAIRSHLTRFLAEWLGPS
jgi:protein-tyrosine phosphatase